MSIDIYGAGIKGILKFDVPYAENVNMDNESIKRILLDIREAKTDFTVVQSGKECARVNGLYKPDTREIILHNGNFTTDNQEVYTAVHEYTHHLIAESNAEKGLPIPGSRVHNQAFWATFDELIAEAEKKGYYKLDIDSSPELASLTVTLQKDYIARNGEIMRDFGRLLARAHELCDAANIRYEDYIDRILRLPRISARDAERVGASNVATNLGYDNMKMISAIKDDGKRAHALEMLSNGRSVASVRNALKSPPAELDEKSMLEKEKARLERTIEQLQERLKDVERRLES